MDETAEKSEPEKAFKGNPWGILTSIDLYGCDPDKIRSSGDIERYVIDLCELIEMKRFGKTSIVNFGEDPRVSGYSMTQLIETSLISGHFANQSNAAYIDIFSCKPYDTDRAVEFSVNFFGAKRYKSNVLERE